MVLILFEHYFTDYSLCQHWGKHSKRMHQAHLAKINV